MPFVTSQKADFRKLSVSVQPAEAAMDFFSDKTLMIVMMLISDALGPFNVELDVESGKTEWKKWRGGPAGGRHRSVSELIKHSTG